MKFENQKSITNEIPYAYEEQSFNEWGNWTTEVIYENGYNIVESAYLALVDSEIIIDDKYSVSSDYVKVIDLLKSANTNCLYRYQYIDGEWSGWTNIERPEMKDVKFQKVYFEIYNEIIEKNDVVRIVEKCELASKLPNNSGIYYFYREKTMINKSLTLETHTRL